jgi:hypothetical protein
LATTNLLFVSMNLQKCNVKCVSYWVATQKVLKAIALNNTSFNSFIHQIHPFWHPVNK